MVDIKRNSDKKRNKDKIVKAIFMLIALFCIAIVLITVIYLIYSGILPFFKKYQVVDEYGIVKEGSLDPLYFFFGNMWSKGDFQYGLGWALVNTIYLTLLQILISAPLGILTALFITRIAPKRIAKLLNMAITVLAGIPSVIIGVFGMGVICPGVRDFGELFNISSAGGKTIISAVIILVLMSLPTITTMSITAIEAVDERLVMSSLALGASKTQTNFKIVLKSAESGIFAGIILGVGRSIGEATAIQMVTGASSGPTFLPFDNTSTITTTMLSGLGEANVESLSYAARFSAGLVLIVLIILTNLGLNAIKTRIYNKQNGIVSMKKR